MTLDVQKFKGLKEDARHEDAADFSIGTDDAAVMWYSSQTVKGKNTIPATGWYVQKGKHDDLETAIVAYNNDHAQEPFRLVTIVHPQSKNESEDWIFPEGLSFFVLCRGVKEPWIEKALVNCYTLAWGEKPGGKQESRVYVRAVLADLLPYGYDKPVQLQTSKKGRTKGLLATLLDQQRVLAEFRKQYDMALPFWHFSLPIGADVRDVGNADVSKEMYVPVSLIPAKITEEYLTAHYIGNTPYKPGEGALSLMLAATFKESIEWARDTTKALLKGKPHHEEAPEDSDLPEFEESIEQPRRASTTEASEPALPGQRDGLRRLGMTLQRSDLVDLAESPTLTKAVAGQAILFAQQKKDKK